MNKIMNRLCVVASALAMTFSLSQCAKDNSKDASEEQVRVTLTAVKAEMTKAELTESGVDMAVTWSAGDKLYAVGQKDGYIGYLTLETGAGTSSGEFVGYLKLLPRKQNLRFYYVGKTNSVSGESFNLDLSSQAGTLDGIENTMHVMSAVVADVTHETVEYGTVTMENMISIVKVDTKSAFGEVTGVTLTGTCSSAAINLKTGAVSASCRTISLTGKGANNYYIALIPNGEKQTYLFSYNSNEKYLPSKTIVSGKYYTYSGNPVPLAGYVLEVTPNTTTVPYTGGQTSFSVKSYSTTDDGATKVAVPWTLEYYDAATDKWLPLNSSSVPSSMFDASHTFSKFSGAGSGSAAESVTADVIEGTKTVKTETIQEHNQRLRDTPSVGTQATPYDLSMHTVTGEQRAAGCPVTANCYVVSAPGWYSLPLVYGNSYNGSTSPNTAAYAPAATTNKSTYLTPFRNAVGTINSACGGVIETDLGVTLTTAAVQWEDLQEEGNPSMIGSVDVISAPSGSALSCKYMRFYVSPTNIRQGNLILKVTDGTKTCWSWHIWVTDQSIDTMPVRYGTKDDVTVDMMAMNLGWCDGSTSETTSYSGADLKIRVRQTDGKNPAVADELTLVRTKQVLLTISADGGSPYYQWGRKDPMLPGVAISETTPKPYLGERTTIDRSKTMGVNNIAYSIQNPGAFIGDATASDGMWYYEGWGTGSTKATYYNLWDATATSSTDKATVKSIYDPCPPGFKVPRQKAFSYFSTGNKIGNFNAGFTFKRTSTDAVGVFIHAAGYRNHENGGLASMGTYGHYWTSNQNGTAGNATLLRFKSTQVQPSDNEQQCNGYSIRPVRDN